MKKALLGLVGLVILASVIIPIADRYISSPLTKEAKTQVQQYFETILVKCGDSYYLPYEVKGFFYASGVYQLKGFAFRIEAETLTEADKANGILWQGIIKTYCAAWRKDKGKWRDCIIPEILGLQPQAAWNIYKQGNQWFAQPWGRKDFSNPQPPKFTCEDMSK